jgi:hydroxymethylpyrimidine pyrophosphatase-like HAD family hydrolase
MEFVPERFPEALFLDLDGTVLAPGAVLRQATVDALQEAAQRGSVVVLATGGFSERTRLVASIVARRAAGRVWAITHNGGAVWDPDGALVRRVAMPPRALEASLAAAGPRLWVTFETVDNRGESRVYYAGRMRHELVHYIWGPQPTAGEACLAPTPALGCSGTWSVPDDHRRSDDACGDLTVGLEPRWDWRRARDRDVVAAGALGCWAVGTPEALAPLDAQAVDGRLYGARYAPWGARLGQLLNRPRLRIRGRDVGAEEASKGTAAAWLCARLGIDPAQTAAFGDGDNDLEMLAFAGTSVAMANATPAVLRAVEYVAPSNGEDGVAQVVRRWLRSAPAARPRATALAGTAAGGGAE